MQGDITIEVDKQFYDNEYSEFKNKFFDKVSQGFNKQEVEMLRGIGCSDDYIFIAMLIGVYEGNLKMGMNI